jgi:hypothetical protein
MSLSFAPAVNTRLVPGSTFVIAGMLAAVLFCLVLSTAFGVGSAGAETMFVGP